METGCSSLHRLRYKAVKALIIVLSLLFYVVGMHTHYYQRTLTVIGALREAEPEVQQQALHSLFENTGDTEDGIYVMMKSGYHYQGQTALYIDIFVIVLTVGFAAIVFMILQYYKRSSSQKAYMLENELNYLKEEVEHFLYGSEITRKDGYEACNYLLDRLEQKVYDVNELNESELGRMMTFHQNIIHQIYTPLNTIKLLTEQLAQENAIEKSYQETMNYAVDKAARLAYIYMRASKMDAGKVILEYEELQLHDLIEDIFKLLKITADHFNASLINQCDDSIIYADEAWIKEVITNIVKNAIENAGDGKTVMVSSMSTSESVRIFIDDNGDADVIVDEVVFERFESSKTGIGIGLHLCKQIVEKHLGKITVERSPLGGLRFVIELPKYSHKQKIELEEKDENNRKDRECEEVL